MKRISLILTTCLVSVSLNAQNSVDDFSKQAREQFDAFKKKSQNDFQEFRRKINSEYSKFLEERWQPVERKDNPAPPTEPAPVPPVIFDEKDPPAPEPPKPIEIRRVISAPKPVAPPQPVAPLGDEIQPNLDLIPIRGSRPVKPKDTNPIATIPQGQTKPNLDINMPTVTPREPMVSVRYYGTPLNLRWNKQKNFHLNGLGEKSVAQAWNALSDGRADPLLRDCLDLRERLDLDDWAYIKLLDNISATIAGKDSNEAALLMAWLYCQSGYKMRLAASDSRLYMLFSSEHLIYFFPTYHFNGETFYAYNCKEKGLTMSPAEFPKERPLSLIISNEPRLASDLSDERQLKSKRYNLDITAQTNKNLLALYDTYPTSYMGGDIMTRWAMYANVPATEEFKEFLYPAMRQAVSGKTKRDGAEILLNWVQTALKYEYDENVWGQDRAFFADESIYYPFCDCEDRSILFSRLVRDILGLDVVLVYYPGHLATAVAFDEPEPRGDYLKLNNRLFTVCDPTYIGASTGRTMPGMDNNAAQVILLNR